MTDQDLKLLEQEMIKSMDDELKVETEIREKSAYIGQLLMSSEKIKIEIDEKEFSIAYRIIKKSKKDILLVVATNLFTYSIAPAGKYKPYTILVEVDTEYSMQENVTAAIEAFIRHLTGKIKPEILE